MLKSKYIINNIDSISFSAMLTFFTVSMIAGSGHDIKNDTFLFLFFFSLVCVVLGNYLLKLGNIGVIKARTSAAYIVGFFMISSLLYGLIIIFGISAEKSRNALLLVCLFAFFIYRSNEPNEQNVFLTEETKLVIPLILIAFAALYKYASIPMQIISEGQLNIWSDYFLHGVTMEMLGGRFAYGGSFELIGLSIDKYYHYLPFMFGSVVMTVQEMNGLSIATSVLLPQGVLICLLGIYVLCAELSSLRIGLIVTIVSILIPGYSILFQSGWFDPYWGVFIQPGASYALALCLLVVAAMKIYYDSLDKRIFAAMSLLTLIVGITRFHFFLLIAPFILWVVISRTSKDKPYKWLKIFTILGLLILVLSSLTLGNGSGWLEYAKTKNYLDFTADQLLFHGVRLYSSPVEGSGAYLLLISENLLAIVGIYAIIYPIILMIKSRNGLLDIIDLIPYLILLVFLFCMIYAGVPRNDDPSEYKHRHFPLVYIIFAIYCNNYIISRLGKFLRYFSKKYYGASIAAVIVSTLPFIWKSEAAKPNLKSMGWAMQFHGNKQEADKMALAKFIQGTSLKGDAFLFGSYSGRKSRGRNNNIITELIALTGVPAFLSRADLFKLIPGCYSVVANERIKAASAIANAADWSSAVHLLIENQVRWYILDKNDKPHWAGTREPAYENNRFAVFDSGYTNINYGIVKYCGQ